MVCANSLKFYYVTNAIQVDVIQLFGSEILKLLIDEVRK